MKQVKVSIPEDEWQLVVSSFNKQKKLYRKKGIRSPTALLRHWIRNGLERLETQNE